MAQDVTAYGCWMAVASVLGSGRRGRILEEWSLIFADSARAEGVSATIAC